MLIQDLKHIETVQGTVRGGLLIASDATVVQSGRGLRGYSSTYSSLDYGSYYLSAYTSGSAQGSVRYGSQVVNSSSIIIY